MTEEIRHGDVLDRLREMPNGTVQCVITSPPVLRAPRLRH